MPNWASLAPFAKGRMAAAAMASRGARVKGFRGNGTGPAPSPYTRALGEVLRSWVYLVSARGQARARPHLIGITMDCILGPR